MKILGDLECFREKIFFNNDQKSARNNNGIKTSEAQQSSKHWLKKKVITTTSKRVFESNNMPVGQEYKQNQLTKQNKALNQYQQIARPNSNIGMFSTPFRTKNNNNYIEETPVFVKSQNKNHLTQLVMDVSKQLSPYGSAKSAELKQLQKKILESKLSNYERWQSKQEQNKKKSVSYRIHIPSKQFNFTNINLQKYIKTNTHQIIPSQYEMYEHRRRHQNKTQMDKKSPLLNRQKSSQSFSIKKKFNTNVIESLKPEQEKFSNRFTYIMQKFKKDHFAEEDNLSNLLEIPHQGVIKSQQSSKDHERTIDGQTKKQSVKNEHKQQQKKEHHLKGGRSLKIKVNKLIKQQQNLFKKAQSGEKQHSSNKRKIFKTQHHEQKKQPFQYHTNQQIDFAALKESVKVVQNPSNIFDDDHEKDENSIVINQANVKEERAQSSEEVLKSSLNGDSEKRIQNNSNMLWVKNQRQSENGSNFKNRKSKIASIRAIKNYIKRNDNEERSPCPPQQKEPNLIGTFKKREKQTSCLTHKIKWGNPSKKKFNSEIGILATSNQFFKECSVEGKIKSEVKRFQIQQPKIQQKQHKKMITIEAELKDQKPKNKLINIFQFAENQSQTAKAAGFSNKKNNNNHENEHQKMNQEIDIGILLERTCSKPLVGFEDPGISVIANNNDSIHMADTRLILPSFQRLPFQALQMIDNSMISPVAMMKRVKQDPVDERMQSLQELYSELYCKLRSHKQLPFKAGNQLLRLNSIQEFFQKQ